ncbi:hypothetical protein, variant [Phytophthora nicotianae]|uniref:Uncharacterized protein n=1 Tax=Phytophthora nicotianae TaxID=4792 RepID=W2LWB3_PHYNI|nr:hypothetical protein, variant [Phytophthora nicotianae]
MTATAARTVKSATVEVTAGLAVTAATTGSMATGAVSTGLASTATGSPTASKATVKAITGPVGTGMTAIAAPTINPATSAATAGLAISVITVTATPTVSTVEPASTIIGSLTASTATVTATTRPAVTAISVPTVPTTGSPVVECNDRLARRTRVARSSRDRVLLAITVAVEDPSPVSTQHSTKVPESELAERVTPPATVLSPAIRCSGLRKGEWRQLSRHGWKKRKPIPCKHNTNFLVPGKGGRLSHLTHGIDYSEELVYRGGRGDGTLE